MVCDPFNFFGTTLVCSLQYKKEGETKKFTPLLYLKFIIIYVYATVNFDVSLVLCYNIYIKLLGGIYMFKQKFKFRWLTKVPFGTKLHLKYVCLNTDLYAPGYSGMISLMNYCKSKYRLNCSISFCDGLTTFRFEPIS